jgi:hypothetical protein
MKQSVFISLFLAMGFLASCQKFYLAPYFGAQFAANVYAPKSSKPADDFHIPVPEFVPTIGMGIHYKYRNFTHKLNVQLVTLGVSFSVDTYNTVVHKMQGGHQHTTSKDHALFNYSIQKEENGYRKFLGQRLKLKGSIGVGFGTNKSQWQYDGEPRVTYGQLTNNTDYYTHDYTIKRKGFGIFFTPEIGFDLFNKKKKRFLSFDLFYYKGLKDMAAYDIKYTYGSYTDNIAVSRQQKVISRGTTFGAKIGFPIRLIK